MAIYKKSIRKSIINHIFVILLLLKNFVYCKIKNNFNYNLDYKSI